jgi:hypothetical protein
MESRGKTMDEMEAKKDGSKELKCATSNQLDVNNG